jgi:cobalt-precorrin 5A hydrolase
VKAAVVAITKLGASLGEQVASALGSDAKLYLPQDSAHHYPKALRLEKPLREEVEGLFKEFDALIFIMATGIVVRLIGSHLQDKHTDPAVVVIDERGKFAISLVSGHLGGANELTKKVAAEIGAQPVITTATDIEGKLAIDLLAKELDCHIENSAQLRKVSRAILEDLPVAMFTEIDLENWQERILNSNIDLYQVGDYSPELTQKYDAYIFITIKDIAAVTSYLALDKPYLILHPRRIIAGIGYRREVTKDDLSFALESSLNEVSISRYSLAKLATLELKRGEEGIVALADELDLPLVFISPYQIEQLEGYSGSESIRRKVGVGGVCEPVALLAGKETRLILAKKKFPKVTIALAEEGCG